MTVLAPIAILAVWGSSYVWSCVVALSAPGKPVEFKYKSLAGTVRLRADAYSIDWDHGFARAEHPRIFDPAGSEIVSAEHIDASGISLPNLKSITLNVRNVQGRLVRLRDGTFDIQDYLPERKGPASTIPFSVTVNRADLAIEDLFGATPYRQRAVAEGVEVRGIGDNWLATGSVSSPGLGSIQGEVDNLPGEGLLVRAKTTGFQLEPVLEHVRATRDIEKAPFLKDLSARSMEVSGPMSLLIAKGQGTKFEGQINASADGVKYREYAADHVSVQAAVDELGASGRLDASLGRVKANLDGAYVWQKEPELGGQLHLDTPSEADLPRWLHRLVPAAVSSMTDAHVDGWLAYKQGGGLSFQGPIQARNAVVYEQPIEQPKVAIAANPNEVRVGIEGGRWAGTPLTGAMIVGVKSPTLTGALTAGSVDLATVANRLGTKGISGKARVSLLLGGLRTNPTAILQAEGNGNYRVHGKLITGKFQAVGNLANDQLVVERLRIGTSAGSARAIGTVSIKNKTLSLKVDATNLRLETLRENLSGNLNASGIVGGTTANPSFKGQAVALDVKVSGKEIPFASSDVTADRTRIQASGLRVVKGTGEAVGDLALNLKTRTLTGSGSAKNLLLNEYLGDDALGTVTVPSITVGGTLDKPLVAGTAFGENLLLGGIRVDRADLESSLNGTVATLDKFVAKVGDGSVHGSGKYDYQTKAGTFTARADNLALDRITPPGKGAANVVGRLNGQAQGSISPSGTVRGKASGKLENVSLNDTEFGNGNWNIGYDGIDVTGSASIGKLDRFLLLENVDFDTTSEIIKGQVSVLNGSLQDLYTSAKPFFTDLSFDAKQRLDTAEGDLDATVAISGPIHNPDIDFKLLEAHNLALQSKPLGDLKAILSRTGTTWNIDTFNWAGPQGILVLNKSSIDTEGNLTVDGELSKFDLQYVGLLDPDWARLQGEASLSFLATGRSASPDIRASLETTKGSAFTIGATNESFRINLDTVNVRQALYAPDGSYTGGISASGKFFYRGFTGDVVASIPLNYPLDIPEGPEIKASLTIPNIDVKDLAQYAGAIDTARSKGTLRGTISLIGSKTNLGLRGSILGTADVLAFNDMQTTLNAAIASVNLENNRIVLSIQSQGSSGGTFAADLAADFPDLRSTLDQLVRGDTDKIVNTPVQGSIAATDFAVRQDSKDRNLGTYHATVNAKLAVAGPAMKPLVSGRVGVTNTNILLPSTFNGSAGSAELAFNPHFDIPIQLDEIARFRTSTADVSLTGGGQLTGTLARPNFNATMNVQSGRINLPTAKVTLEEGGTLRPSYSVGSSGDSNARVDVDLEGTTAVTALRFGDTVQRYDVRLFITGDLLSDAGLNLNATSDPPDLSKDEILALLGQTDVLKSIGSASGASQSETEARIRSALVSIAVPQLTESFTSQLATGLGLEYLNVDYNQFEGASIDFAKVLGKGLVLQGRRQVSPTYINRRLDYDLRLTYRLPSKSAALNRVVFSVGLDQDRPYKIGVEYGFRF